MSKKWMTSLRAKNVQFRILKSGEAGWKCERAWKQAHVSFSSNTLVKGEHVMTVEFSYGKRIDVPIADEMDKFQVQAESGRVIITSHKKRSTFNIKDLSSNQATLVGTFLQKIMDGKMQKETHSPVKLQNSKSGQTNSPYGKLTSPQYNDGPFKRNNLSPATGVTCKVKQTGICGVGNNQKGNKNPVVHKNQNNGLTDKRQTKSDKSSSMNVTPEKKNTPVRISSLSKRKSASPHDSLSKKNCPSHMGVNHDAPLPTLKSPTNRRRLFETKHNPDPHNATTTDSDLKATSTTTPTKDHKRSHRKFDDFRRAQAEVRHAKIESENIEEKENTSPPSGTKSSGISKRSFYGSNSLTSNFASELSKVRIVHATPSPKRKIQTPSKIQNYGNARRSLLQETTPKKSASQQQRFENWSEKNKESVLFSPLSTDIASAKADVFDDNNNDNNKENFVFQPLADTANFTFSSVEGFQNLGNTCYMNSTLQSLFGLLPFQYDLYSLGKKFEQVLHNDSLLRAMVHLMKHRLTTSDSEKRILLKKVKLAISASAKQFYGFLQHDAHEFLRLCLDTLQEDITKANKALLSESNNNNVDVSTSAVKPNAECPVSKNFSFTVAQQITCNKCKSVTKAKDEWYDLPVELQQRQSENGGTLHLQKLINSSFAEESIEHSCEKCKSNQATVKRNIAKLPRIMMIYLKRYSYNQTSYHSEKLRLPVVLPPYISFERFCNRDITVNTDVATLDDDFYKPASNKSPNAQMEVVILTSDDEPEKPLADDLNTNNSKTVVVDECNNNPDSLKPINNDEVIDLLPIENDKELTKALEMSEMEFFSSQQKQFKDIVDSEKLRNLSEEQQVLLAMELSLRNEKDTSFLQSCDVTANNNNTTNIDSNENITTDLCNETRNKENIQKTSVKTQNTKPATVENPQIVPSISPKKDIKLSDATRDSGSADSEATMSFSTVGSTKLDAFLSGEDTDHDDEDVVFPVFGQTNGIIHHDGLANNSPAKTKKSSSTDPISKPEEYSPTVVDEKLEEEILKEANAYRLVSVISHKGGSSNVGHYVSDVMSEFPSRKWQCFNDSHVENVTESEVLLGRQSTSYLLFYLHKDFLHLYKSSN